MSKGRNALLIGVVVISAGICGTAYAQEANQMRDVELGQTVYRTGFVGSTQIERNTAQDFIDRVSGTDRSLAEDVRELTAQPTTQASFMAEAPGAESSSGSLVQDYIDRTSGRSIYRYR